MRGGCMSGGCMRGGCMRGGCWEDARGTRIKGEAGSTAGPLAGTTQRRVGPRPSMSHLGGNDEVVSTASLPQPRTDVLFSLSTVRGSHRCGVDLGSVYEIPTFACEERFLTMQLRARVHPVLHALWQIQMNERSQTKRTLQCTVVHCAVFAVSSSRTCDGSIPCAGST